MLLAIYLNDHLAGATVGRDLSRRAAASNRYTSYGPSLDYLSILEAPRLVSPPGSSR
jgi:hypothetical protein